jgi:hypothetical protein
LPVSLAACLLVVITYAQPAYTRVRQVIAENFSDTLITAYCRVYVVDFGFCSGTRFCGETLCSYLEKEAMKRNIVVITPDTGYVCLNGERVRLIYLSSVDIARSGIFSVYPYYVTAKKIKYVK